MGGGAGMEGQNRGCQVLVLFDIGGSRIKAARAQRPGMVEILGDWPTPGKDFDAFNAVLRAAVALAGSGAAGVAVSIAGVVNPDTGTILVANIPCLDGRVLARDLTGALGCPVVVANDADCFALAEAGTGAGVGHRVVFGVILGTGAGGGLVIDGRIHLGAGGYAGEWGHGPVLRSRAAGEAVEFPHWPCGCGQSGCVDTVGSARGLERLDRHLNGEERSSVVILEDWLAGEGMAVRTVSAWLDLVSGPLAMVINVVGPSVVPVGGGLSNVPALVAALDAAVRGRILRRTLGPLLVCARHRVEPGLIGAGLLGFGEFGLG